MLFISSSYQNRCHFCSALTHVAPDNLIPSYPCLIVLDGIRPVCSTFSGSSEWWKRRINELKPFLLRPLLKSMSRPFKDLSLYLRKGLQCAQCAGISCVSAGPSRPKLKQSNWRKSRRSFRLWMIRCPAISMSSGSWSSRPAWSIPSHGNKLFRHSGEVNAEKREFVRALGIHHLVWLLGVLLINFCRCLN